MGKNMWGYHKKIKEIVIVKPSCMNQENARQFAQSINKPVIYLEDWKGIEGHTLDEIQRLIDEARSGLQAAPTAPTN